MWVIHIWIFKQLIQVEHKGSAWRQLNTTCVFAPRTERILHMGNVCSCCFGMGEFITHTKQAQALSCVFGCVNSVPRAWGKAVGFDPLCTGPCQGLMKPSSPVLSRVLSKQLHFPKVWQYLLRPLMGAKWKFLENQDCCYIMAEILNTLKMFSWPVAVIKEGLIVLLCICSPVCGLGMERQRKRFIFPRLQGNPSGAGDGMHLLRIPAWGPCPAVWLGPVCCVTELLLKCSSCSVAAVETELAVGNVYHPAHNEAITLQSQLWIAANRFSFCFLS